MKDILSLLVFLLGCAITRIAAWANETQFVVAVNRTQPITLAVSPACGAFNSSNFTEFNTGIQLNATKTIVAFGDSWTSNGSNGTIPLAAIVHPPNPSAGAAYGNNYRARGSNGYIWVEDLGNTIGAKVIDYAVVGAVTDLNAWNATNHGPTYTGDNVLRVDFVDEVNLFLQQGHFLSDLNPNTTLYTVQFGINDRGEYLSQGGNWTEAINTYLKQISILQAQGARNFLIHWMYITDPISDAYQSAIHAGLQKAHQENGTNFAEVNLAHLFGAINASLPTFGYTNYTCLASGNTTDFGCNDTDHAVFYIPGHPSLVSHELINQYTIQAIQNCV